MPELRPARENARLEIGSKRGRNSHQTLMMAVNRPTTSASIQKAGRPGTSISRRGSPGQLGWGDKRARPS